MSMSSESMLDAEAELTLDREELPMDRTSWSLTVPTEPVRRWWFEEDEEDEGRRSVVAEVEAEEEEEDEEEAGAGPAEEGEELWRAASSMLSEACSSWAVMSSRERLETRGRAWLVPPRTVEEGEARALLLLLPPLLLPPPPAACLALPLRPTGGFCRSLVSLGTPRRAAALLGLLMVLSSCSMEHRSAIRASRSTASPWFRASETTATRTF